MDKITLYGFNNLTKSLSFSLYKLHYIACDDELRDYNRFINATYNSQKLKALLTRICHAIGGNVLNVAKQDYQPQGASVTLMISEESEPQSLIAHLDKSHLCIHTYPEESPQNNLAVFRADLELSTCGVISPLKVVNEIIERFNPDIADIDYRVRGMTRNKQGQMLFNDGKINQLSEHLNHHLITHYTYQENSIQSQNLFHCKLKRKKLQFAQFLFKNAQVDYKTSEQEQIMDKAMTTIENIFNTTPVTYTQAT